MGMCLYTHDFDNRYPECIVVVACCQNRRHMVLHILHLPVLQEHNKTGPIKAHIGQAMKVDLFILLGYWVASSVQVDSLKLMVLLMAQYTIIIPMMDVEVNG